MSQLLFSSYILEKVCLKTYKNMTEKVRTNENPQYFFQNEFGLYYCDFDVFCNWQSKKRAQLLGKALVTLCKLDLLLKNGKKRVSRRAKSS